LKFEGRCSKALPVTIENFLKEFRPKEPQLEDELADLGFDDDDAEGMDDETASLWRGKYMKQLVWMCPSQPWRRGAQLLIETDSSTRAKYPLH
jgi:hypothetical protein